MDFSKLNGLIPAVAQDDESGEVLMVGFMNEDAFELTRRTGYVTFYSRSRRQLWMKGETSGNRLAVARILTDCDDDSVVVRVIREGDGLVCHTGTRSCFTKDVAFENQTRTDFRSGAPGNQTRTDFRSGTPGNQSGFDFRSGAAGNQSGSNFRSVRGGGQ